MNTSKKDTACCFTDVLNCVIMVDVVDIIKHVCKALVAHCGLPPTALVHSSNFCECHHLEQMHSVPCSRNQPMRNAPVTDAASVARCHSDVTAIATCCHWAHENITSSTKLEIRNILQCCQRRIDQQLQEHDRKFGEVQTCNVFPKIYRQTRLSQYPSNNHRTALFFELPYSLGVLYSITTNCIYNPRARNYMLLE